MLNAYYSLLSLIGAGAPAAPVAYLPVHSSPAPVAQPPTSHTTLFAPSPSSSSSPPLPREGFATHTSMPIHHVELPDGSALVEVSLPILLQDSQPKDESSKDVTRNDVGGVHIQPRSYMATLTSPLPVGRCEEPASREHRESSSPSPCTAVDIPSTDADMTSGRSISWTCSESFNDIEDAMRLQREHRGQDVRTDTEEDKTLVATGQSLTMGSHTSASMGYSSNNNNAIPDAASKHESGGGDDDDTDSVQTEPYSPKDMKSKFQTCDTIDGKTASMPSAEYEDKINTLHGTLTSSVAQTSPVVVACESQKHLILSTLFDVIDNAISHSERTTGQGCREPTAKKRHRRRTELELLSDPPTWKECSTSRHKHTLATLATSGGGRTSTSGTGRPTSKARPRKTLPSKRRRRL